MNNDSLFFRNLSAELVIGSDAAQQRLLREYGAVLVAERVVPPDRIIFADEEDVERFQSQLETASGDFGEHTLELQADAMQALLSAGEEARSRGFSISPRGRDSARRNYNGTVELWKSRVEPALEHWVSRGRLSSADADAIRALSPADQVSRVFELEEEGIYFAKDLSKSIIYSVAPPGASQHLSMLAFDVAEFDDARVREILAEHEWYQTVVSDLPHFTFLGVELDELETLGLKRVNHIGRDFWVPDL